MQPAFEKITHGPDRSFRHIEFAQPRFGAPWHFHPEYELTLIVQSRGMRLIGDHLSRYTDGDLVLVGPNVPHCWANDPLPRGKLAHAVVLQFRPDCLGPAFFELPEMRSVKRLFQVPAGSEKEGVGGWFMPPS